MDTAKAIAMAEANVGAPHMVFDWDKAARLIRDQKPGVASAGLRSDWEYTGGEIFADGKPVPEDDTYTYLRSYWAVPELDLDGEVVECYAMQDDKPEWDEKTYWPESALVILGGIEEAAT